MSAEIIAFKRPDKPAVKPGAAPASKRVDGLDILRGLCVMGMILVAYAGDWNTRFGVLRHADWHGLALADMIFPGFLFCAGMALPLSLSHRAARSTRTGLSLHILWRAGALIALGVALNAIPAAIWGHLRLPGILQRIGLCYGLIGVFCLAIGRKSDSDVSMKIWPVAVAAAILLAAYALMLLLWTTPACPGRCFDQVNALPAVVDRFVFTPQFMWQYGTDKSGAVTYDPEGLVSTLGALGNVLIGVMAALYVRRDGLSKALPGLLMLGVTLFVFGAALDAQLPIVKKIWTPSFTLVSAGVSLVAFSVLALVADVLKARSWAYPIRVFGSNATLAFVGISLIDVVMQLPLLAGKSAHDTLSAWLNGAIGNVALASFTYSAGLLVVLGLLLWPLYIKRWFVKI
jgi:predicted acyltransferase